MRFLTDYSESNKSSNTAINTTSGTDKAMSAVALDKNRVFIAYFHPVGVSGIVCTIQGSTIAVGTHTILYSGSNMGLTVSAVVLNASKVFVAYSYGSSCKLYAIICTIQGSTITAGAGIQLSTTSNSGEAISVAKLDEGKVFIVHSYESNYYLYGVVCTISGTTITKGADTKLCSEARNGGSKMSVVALNNSKVFVTFSHYVNSMILYGTVCEISGTTIKAGTITGIKNSSIPPHLSVSTVTLSSSKVFVAFSYGNDKILCGFVCTINETTIVIGTVYSLNSTTCTGEAISTVPLNEKTVQIIHSDSNNYLYSMLCNIDGTIITKKSDNLVSNVTNSGKVISITALNEENIFIGHSSGTNNCLHGMLVGYLENLVKTITSSTEQINGIAITDGQAGEMVQVKKPDETFMCSFNASVTAEGKSVTWNNVILTHRKVLDGNTRVYSSVKSLEIGGIVYEFKFFIHYKEDTAVAWTGWKFGWEFSPKLYASSATAPQNTTVYASPIQKQITRSSKFYTEQLNGGVEITLTETETPIFD